MFILYFWYTKVGLVLFSEQFHCFSSSCRRRSGNQQVFSAEDFEGASFSRLRILFSTKSSCSRPWQQRLSGLTNISSRVKGFLTDIGNRLQPISMTSVKQIIKSVIVLKSFALRWMTSSLIRWGRRFPWQPVLEVEKELLESTEWSSDPSHPFIPDLPIPSFYCDQDIINF